MDLKSRIREIKDFPREGINYRDISTLLQDSDAYRQAIKELVRMCDYKRAEMIVCPKERGLVIGAPLAYVLGTGLIVLHKAGKEPCDEFIWHYNLEFGSKACNINTEVIKPGTKVLVVDELIATGGTAATAIKLIEELAGEVVGTVFLIELTSLGGRVKLQNYDTISLVQYNY